MGGRWNPIRFHLFKFFLLIPSFVIEESLAINSDGSALLKFRARIGCDPYGALLNWNSNDSTPCMWLGVHCVDSKVQMLDLGALSLEGTLAPELGKLSDLRSLVLYKNHFSGAIPKEFGELTKLELLDLRKNNLCGMIPPEILNMLSLKHLLLGDNKFDSCLPSELWKLNLLSELQLDENLMPMLTTGIGCVSRKLGLRFKLQKESLAENQDHCCSDVPSSSMQEMDHDGQRNLVPFERRKLVEQSKNLPAVPPPAVPSTEQIFSVPTTRSSGTFSAVPKKKNREQAPQVDSAPPGSTNSEPVDMSSESSEAEPPAQSGSGNLRKYLIAILCVAILLFVVVVVIMYRKQAEKTIGPWKTGLSGQLQKAFVTGVPKLNRSELEKACEDFSNIIDLIGGCTVYKGTLSSGVEIAVASIGVLSLKEWSNNSEIAYRRKIDSLSRVNHKNFVNLIGFCEENEPFCRMMVFEYAPNGTLFEHLHVKEMEHLDWTARVRIIMGVAYCLQYMHDDLNPPLPHSNLSSKTVFLTDDYAAKVGEIASLEGIAKLKSSGDGKSEHSELPPVVDQELNVYSFGVLLLEIISGKLAHSDEQGPIEKWADEYLKDKGSISKMIDPILNSFKYEELEVICDVVRECILMDPRQRPTMKDVTSKLRQAINIAPEQATPRLSPLWWAELEILSLEAT
ncbi:putative LRR receptor-like serine/threonine-protein kinase [Hibiscus syriacus]|uniref:LRR receptor-like serine/threonine-protein kinase n=1 Tax=Hibiscus syriacus TaxID=106335 RepID=A0A6A2ZA15_HIBSY|nr:protein MALE DISCOVERER 2-like [Hibiscus syriacus]KAE8688259.1 putative LRR receptor-like serine/threonine-protein kinase [Hibiscus syriacus]